MRRRIVRTPLLGLLVVGCALAGAPSAMAGRWFPAFPIATGDAIESHVAVYPSGEAVIVFDHKKRGAIEASVRPAGAGFAPPGAISPTGALVPYTLANRGGDLAVFYTQGDFGQPGQEARLVRRPAGSGFQAPLPLPAQLGRGAAPFLDPHGNLVYTWIEQDDSTSPPQYRLIVATWAANGTFGPIRQLDVAGNIHGTSTAVAPDGSVTIAWAASGAGDQPGMHHLYAATAAPGQDFGPRQEIGAPFYAIDTSPPLRVQADDRGGLVLVWAVEDKPPWYPEIVVGAGGPARFEWSYRPPDGVFAAPREIAIEGSRRGIGNWDLATNGAGDSVLAWNDYSGFGVWKTYRPAGGVFGPAPKTALNGAAVPTRVAIGPAGDAAVLYVGTDGVTASTWAARGSAFGAPVVVAKVRPGEGGRIADLGIGVDGVGNAVAVWSTGDRFRYDGDHTQSVEAALYDVARPAVSHVAMGTTAPTGLRAKDAARPALLFTLSEAARVSVKIELARHGGGTTLGTIRGRSRGGSRRMAIPAKLAHRLASRANYRAVITAIDSVGRRSKPKSVRFSRLHG